MADFCQLWLTCKDKTEAKKITTKLLEKRLVVCVKQLPVAADYWWEGKIERAEEVLLAMESRVSFFDEVEAEVAKLHSYDTFVLEAIPIVKVSKKAHNWLAKELQ